MKTSEIKYITIKRYDYYGSKAIPTGKVREGEAEFFCIHSKNPERFVWLRREDIY